MLGIIILKWLNSWAKNKEYNTASYVVFTLFALAYGLILLNRQVDVDFEFLKPYYKVERILLLCEIIMLGVATAYWLVDTKIREKRLLIAGGYNDLGGIQTILVWIIVLTGLLLFTWPIYAMGFPIILSALNYRLFIE